jgi:hypothetical protein
VDLLKKYPESLTPTTASVLAIALNLPRKDGHGEELKYTIFTDNLFTSYKLFSILQQHGFAACGTSRINRFGDHFQEEIIEKNNGKLLQWGEIRMEVKQKDKGEPVLLFI